MATEYSDVSVRDQLGRPVDTSITVKRFGETIVVEENATRVYTNTVGHSFILGHRFNGKLGETYLGMDGQQVGLGEQNRSGEVLVRVFNSNNTFIDHFTTTNFKNASATSADWAVSAEELSFTNGEVAESSEVVYQVGTIASAKISVTLSSGAVTDLAFELTADGGSNWESVSHNTNHVFTNTGNDLRFKITASGTVVVSQVNVEYTKS